MSGIEDAIKRIEEAAVKQRDLTVEESRAIKDAVGKASREARDSVKSEYKDRRAQVKREVEEAEKAVKDARARIEKALGSDTQTKKSRAPRGSRASTLQVLQGQPGFDRVRRSQEPGRFAERTLPRRPQTDRRREAQEGRPEVHGRLSGRVTVARVDQARTVRAMREAPPRSRCPPAPAGGARAARAKVPRRVRWSRLRSVGTGQQGAWGAGGRCRSDRPDRRRAARCGRPRPAAGGELRGRLRQRRSCGLRQSGGTGHQHFPTS